MDQQYTAEGRVPSRRFNWRAATLASAVTFLAVQASVLGASKACVTHFDFDLMFNRVLVWLFFDFIIWVPLGLAVGFLTGRLLPRGSRPAFIVLASCLVVIPVATFAVVFFTTAYTTNAYACAI